MKRPHQTVRRYSRNSVSRDFVVGDVHGCFSLLAETLNGLQYDASRAVHLDRKYISLLEQGRRSPTLDTVVALCRGLIFRS